ncbi:MAG: chloride channel protein [Burkholderiales bacterium]|nr:chloride channel protein [Burkholderiales bacterium]
MNAPEHWLARPRTVRLLWRAFLAVLSATVLAELVFEREPHFAIERVFAFTAWYGFLACAALILAAKALGVVLKRPDTYYDAREGDD